MVLSVGLAAVGRVVNLVELRSTAIDSSSSARAADVFARAYDPPPGFPPDAVRAPPLSEVVAESKYRNIQQLSKSPADASSPYLMSWVDWYHIRSRNCTTFHGANPCGIEWDMWMLGRALITAAVASPTVLELGARYGTTSCVLSEVTGNSGRLIAVEPDPRVHEVLKRNRDAHKCNFGLFRGTIGKSAQFVDVTKNKSYDLQTRNARPGVDPPSAILDHLSVDELASRSGLGHFNVLVVDCEGCVADLELSDSGWRHLELLLVEMDTPRKANWAAWHYVLEEHGFKRIWRLEDSIWGGRAPVHAAYHRPRGTVVAHAPLPTCREYADRQRGWPRCVYRNESIRKGLVKESYRCGTRLTCLNADLVNGSVEQAAVQRIRNKLMHRREAKAAASASTPARSSHSSSSSTRVHTT